VTHQPNQAYFEKVWAAPHTINPDRLAKSNKAVRFDGFTGKHVLTDGKRPIEIHSIAVNGHNDAFVLVYLPNENSGRSRRLYASCSECAATRNA